MKNHHQEKGIFSLKSPWENNPQEIWIASVLQLSRNFEKFHFPHKLNVDKRKQLVDLLPPQLLTLKPLQSPSLFRAETINPLEKEFLTEHFLTPKYLQQASTGEALIFDQTGQTLITLNIQDHLHFYFLDCKGDIEKGWNQLVNLESTMGTFFPYAFSPKFGFLTSDPTECGTAFHVSLFLQLPALIHTEALDSFLSTHQDEQIITSGLLGNPVELIGDILVIQNAFTLGVSEETLLSSLKTFTTKLEAKERQLRSRLKKEAASLLKDKVSRAFAILLHSYQIEVTEALNALSLLKLGMDLGWCVGALQTELNALFLNCQRAHLHRLFAQKIPQDALAHQRAEFIHRSLKEVKLTI